MTALSRETIKQVDSKGLLADILSIPEHLRDALWRVESASGLMEEWDSPGGLIVAGMGGSAIGGGLARAALGDHASRPIAVSRGYGLPPWATPETTVLLASYSGNTEETLASYEAAGFVGARRVVVTSGGKLAEQARADGVPVIPIPGCFQPRAAVAYLTVATLEVAALCGVAPRMTSEVDVAASHAEALVSEWGPDGADDSLAKKIAGARSVGATFKEDAVFTRFDDPGAVERRTPVGMELCATRGIRVVTPTAFALRIPLLKGALRAAEFALADSPARRFAGFYVAIWRKRA